MKKGFMRDFFLLICLLNMPVISFSQTTPDKGNLGEIAREIKNPVSLFYRIPIHNDLEWGDVDNQLRYTLKAEPVVPFILNKDWKIITRGVLALVGNQYNGVDGPGPTGLNDLNLTAFLAPLEAIKGFVWGAGIAFDLPTATSSLLGSGKWTAGPSVLGLKQTPKWTFGLLLRQGWSYAGNPDRPDVNYAFVNPWIDYTFENGFGLKIESESTFDWTGGGHTVPIRFGVSQVFRMGKRWVGNIDLDGLWYAVHPDAGPRWGVSVTYTMLLGRTAYVKE